MLVKKQIILDFMDTLPEMCSAEEILYSVQLLDEITAGDEDALQSRFLPNEFITAEVDKWLNQ
jgi:hypothetical protein